MSESWASRPVYVGLAGRAECRGGDVDVKGVQLPGLRGGEDAVDVDSFVQADEQDVGPDSPGGSRIISVGTLIKYATALGAALSLIAQS